MRKERLQQGLTLIELVIVIVIAGILATVALKSMGVVTQTARVEQTKNEMEKLAFAIIGNPTLENNGVRTDFGYVGDVGSMPPSLDALFTNPGGYGTWNGPYIKRRFSQITNDYKEDAWSVPYTYSTNNITSTGSGSDIVRQMGNAVSDFTANQVSGLVLDLDGTPPGNTYKDSVTVRLLIPNGTGGMTYQTTTLGPGGSFAFNSIPMGNHDIEVIYEPDNDTLGRFVSVLPNSEAYAEYFLASNVWTGGGGGGGGIEYVSGTIGFDGGDCEEVTFDITNTSPGDIVLTSMTVSWSSPTVWYDEIRFDGPKVWDQDSPCNGTGDVATFSGFRTLSAGETVSVTIKDFEDQDDGDGNDVDMDNVTFTIAFSDGSTFDVTTGSCP